VLVAASNGAAERREQKTVQPANPRPGKQSNNKQLLLRMKPSCTACLASTVTGFFENHRFTYLKFFVFPSTEDFQPIRFFCKSGCRAHMEALNWHWGVREGHL